MDAEQTFVGVQSTSQMLTPKVRVALEYINLFIAITLFCFLVFMHAHYVKQVIYIIIRLRNPIALVMHKYLWKALLDLEREKERRVCVCVSVNGNGISINLLEPPKRSSSTCLLPLSPKPRIPRNAAFWTPQQQQQLRKKKQMWSWSISSSADPSPTPFDLSPPPIDHDFLDTVKTAGAEVSGEGIIETFHNDDEALDAAYNGVVVVDLSHFGRIRVSGEDRTQFLHNQSTANFECLQPGQGCDTVFVTPTARTIDIAHAWVMKSAITLVVSPETCSTITEMLNKYIFFADKVEIQDITNQTSLFVLVGPKSDQVIENLNLGDLVGKPYGTHQHFNVDKQPLTIGVGNFLSEGGFSFLMSPAAVPSVWNTILAQGAIPMGSNPWNKLRVIRGRPAPGMELTKEFNVLEACLWNSISLNKGCYKGQETISRLITYDGIKQRLWGLHLSAAAEPGSIITVDGKKVGKLTSYASGRKQSEHFGLGYIKRQAASEGDTVIVGDNIGATVVEVPFLSQQRPPAGSSTS